MLKDVPYVESRVPHPQVCAFIQLGLYSQTTGSKVSLGYPGTLARSGQPFPFWIEEVIRRLIMFHLGSVSVGRLRWWTKFGYVGILISDTTLITYYQTISRFAICLSYLQNIKILELHNMQMYTFSQASEYTAAHLKQ